MLGFAVLKSCSGEKYDTKLRLRQTCVSCLLKHIFLKLTTEYEGFVTNTEAQPIICQPGICIVITLSKNKTLQMLSCSHEVAIRQSPLGQLLVIIQLLVNAQSMGRLLSVYIDADFSTAIYFWIPNVLTLYKQPVFVCPSPQTHFSCFSLLLKSILRVPIYTWLSSL